MASQPTSETPKRLGAITPRAIVPALPTIPGFTMTSAKLSEGSRRNADESHTITTTLQIALDRNGNVIPLRIDRHGNVMNFNGDGGSGC